jgi:hypothetical protein
MIIAGAAESLVADGSWSGASLIAPTAETSVASATGAGAASGAADWFAAPKASPSARLLPAVYPTAAFPPPPVPTPPSLAARSVALSPRPHANATTTMDTTPTITAFDQRMFERLEFGCSNMSRIAMTRDPDR